MHAPSLALQFSGSILLMADTRVQLLVSQALPATLSRFWFNVLLHFRRPKNLSYWYLFLYLRLLSPLCYLACISLHSSRLPSFSRLFIAMCFLPRYFVLYLRFVHFSLPFISSLSILSSQLFAFRALVLHSLHAYSNEALLGVIGIRDI